MIALTVILGIVALGLIIWGSINLVRVEDTIWQFFVGLALECAWLVCFSLISNMKFGSEQLTGYVYSKSTQWGVSTYHIRFSENAGQDVQPEFCTNIDTDWERDNAKKLDAIVGSGKKVTVNIPAVGWYFTNDIWHCPSNATLAN